MTALTRSPTWCVSPGICSPRGKIDSVLPRVTMAAPPSCRVHGAVDQVALHGGVFVEDRVALRLADLLDHHLLGALGGDAAQLGGVDALPRPCVAWISPESRSMVTTTSVSSPYFFCDRQLHRRLDAGEDDLAVDVLLVLHLIHDPQQVGAFHQVVLTKTKKVGPGPLFSMPSRAAARRRTPSVNRRGRPGSRRSRSRTRTRCPDRSRAWRLVQWQPHRRRWRGR